MTVASRMSEGPTRHLENRVLITDAWAQISRYFLPIWFAAICSNRVAYFVSHDLVGIDARIYIQAAVVAVHGGDPWTTDVMGYRFAAPPPTLTFYMPFALIPPTIGAGLAFGVGILAALWVLRRLELPFWWLLFPPLFDGLLSGNPDPVVLALLLSPRDSLAAAGGCLKVYGIFPLVLAGRWRSVGFAIVLLLVSGPWIPAYLGHAGEVTDVLKAQAYGGQSAWGTLWMIPSLLLLFAVPRSIAAWMAVPTLWPYTQPHYGTLALPAVARSAVASALLAYPLPLTVVPALLWVSVRSIRGRNRAVLATSSCARSSVATSGRLDP